MPGYDFVVEDELVDALIDLETAYYSEPLFECVSFEKFVSDMKDSPDPLAAKAKMVWEFVIVPNMSEADPPNKPDKGILIP